MRGKRFLFAISCVLTVLFDARASQAALVKVRPVPGCQEFKTNHQDVSMALAICSSQAAPNPLVWVPWLLVGTYIVLVHPDDIARVSRPLQDAIERAVSRQIIPASSYYEAAANQVFADADLAEEIRAAALELDRTGCGDPNEPYEPGRQTYRYRYDQHAALHQLYDVLSGDPRMAADAYGTLKSYWEKGLRTLFPNIGDGPKPCWWDIFPPDNHLYSGG